jgi:hypothetical protein
MVRRVFPYFLVFLLLSSLTDDFVASFTPDPADDLAAATDNEFLAEKPVDAHAGPQSPRPWFPRETAAATLGVGPGIFPGRVKRIHEFAFRRPDPLYCHMSLQL